MRNSTRGVSMLASLALAGAAFAAPQTGGIVGRPAGMKSICWK